MQVDELFIVSYILLSRTPKNLRILMILNTDCRVPIIGQDFCFPSLFLVLVIKIRSKIPIAVE